MNEVNAMLRKVSLGCGVVHATLSNVVRAVRLRYAVPFVLLLAAVYLVSIHPWMTNWGSTAAEQQMTLPGDELSQSKTGRDTQALTTQALTIDAPTDVVWQWLVQIGQDRAGFYSYTWLENLIGADIHNADEIHPEWQRLAVGDAWRLVPPAHLFGLGKGATSPVLALDPGRALVLQMFGAHILLPIDEHTTRLIVRAQSGQASLMQTMVVDHIVFTMEKRMLLGLKARAEGLPDSPPALTAIAQIGWRASGLAVAGLFLSQRRRRYWLVLPVLAALPGLATGDAQAGLAGFLAVGITALGFLTFGRSFWGSCAVLGSVVLLTLLLATDAYVAIGLTFTLLLLAGAGEMAAARSSDTVGAPRRLPAPTGQLR